MRGQRLPDGTDWDSSWQPGSYSKFHGFLIVCTPNGEVGLLNPKIHTVTEHEDGTITVSPSILIYPHHDGPGWHGFLERGVWRVC